MTILTKNGTYNNLTLTSVVFEFSAEGKQKPIAYYLTLTSVVFEYVLQF